MRIPKKVICGLPSSMSKPKICEVDKEGWGSCGDAILRENGALCLWARKVLLWQTLLPREKEA